MSDMMVYFVSLMVILAVIATSLWWMGRADGRERADSGLAAKPETRPTQPT